MPMRNLEGLQTSKDKAGVRMYTGRFPLPRDFNTTMPPSLFAFSGCLLCPSQIFVRISLPFLSMRQLAFHDSMSIQRKIAYNTSFQRLFIVFISLFCSMTSKKDCNMLWGARLRLSSRVGSLSSSPDGDELLAEVATESVSGFSLQYARHSASR